MPIACSSLEISGTGTLELGAGVTTDENVVFVGAGPGTLKLDSSATPRALDMSFDDGPEKGNTNLCIYELSEDVWKLCVATRGTVRPNTFTSQPGSGIAVETLERDHNSTE